MSNDTISEKYIKEQRKTYSAIFERYSSLLCRGNHEVYMHFTDIRDKEENIIKTHYSVNAARFWEIIGSLCPGERILFTAIMIGYAQNLEIIDFEDIVFILPTYN